MGALRTTLHPACQVLSWQQGCHRASGAGRGCARLQTWLRQLPSPFPGKQPVPTAEPRVGSQDGAHGKHHLPATSPSPGVPQPSPVEPRRGDGPSTRAAALLPAQPLQTCRAAACTPVPLPVTWGDALVSPVPNAITVSGKEGSGHHPG